MFYDLDEYMYSFDFDIYVEFNKSFEKDMSRKEIKETEKDRIIKEIEIGVESIKEYDHVWLINALLDIEDNVSLPVNQIFD